MVSNHILAAFDESKLTLFKTEPFKMNEDDTLEVVAGIGDPGLLAMGVHTGAFLKLQWNLFFFKIGYPVPHACGTCRIMMHPCEDERHKSCNLKLFFCCSPCRMCRSLF